MPDPRISQLRPEADWPRSSSPVHLEKHLSVKLGSSKSKQSRRKIRYSEYPKVVLVDVTSDNRKAVPFTFIEVRFEGLLVRIFVYKMAQHFFTVCKIILTRNNFSLLLFCSALVLVCTTQTDEKHPTLAFVEIVAASWSLGIKPQWKLSVKSWRVTELLSTCPKIPRLPT